MAGIAAFEASRLTGVALFAGLGALLGAVAPSLSHRFRGGVRVSGVVLKVPQFSELTFVVDDDARLVAWRLYVEVSTRVSTQPLGADEGLLREALSSLYKLFDSTRETLKASRPSVRNEHGDHSVEHFAIRMLNQELRPFLSKWHPLLKEFETANAGAPETTWPYNDQCRAHLSQVSTDMLQYALAFAELAGVRNPEKILARPAPVVP